MEYPNSLKVITEEETKELAGNFSRELGKGDLVILTGELGSGKTFFVKEIALRFGINTVSSPTFSLVNEYSGEFRIYHFDFYRINKASELFDIGFNDYLNDDDSIIFIEWGDMFPEILPAKRIEIKIIVNQDLSRDFYFSKHE